jgi:hypothetical protein
MSGMKMQPEMLFLRELADGVTEHRINLMMQGAKGVDDNVGVMIGGDISAGEQTFKSIGKKTICSSRLPLCAGLKW